MEWRVSSSTQPTLLLKDYIKIVAPGIRFCPTDNEMIDYLFKKRNGNPLANIFEEVDLYEYNPNELQCMFENVEENEFYFFTKTKPQRLNGSRKKRKAGNGRWRIIIGDTKITHGDKFGYKKTLSYYYMQKGKEKKTSWNMHEYSLPLASSVVNGKRKMVDSFVLCRIYKRRCSGKTCEAEDGENASKPLLIADGEFDIDTISSHSSQCPTTVTNDSEQMFDFSSTDCFEKNYKLLESTHEDVSSAADPFPRLSWREIERILMDL